MIVVDMAVVIRTTLLGEVVLIDGNEKMDNVNGGRSISRE